MHGPECMGLLPLSYDAGFGNLSQFPNQKTRSPEEPLPETCARACLLCMHVGKRQGERRALERYLPLGFAFVLHQLQAVFVLQVPVELPLGAVHEAAHRALQAPWKHRQGQKAALSAHGGQRFRPPPKRCKSTERVFHTHLNLP